MKKILEELQSKYPEIKVEEGTDMPAAVVPAMHLPGIMQELKEKHGLNFLAGLTAVDYKEEDRIEVVYQLMSVPEVKELRVKVNLDRNNPEVPSLTTIWPAANVQEREVYDLMGVTFKGHPDLKRILCPDDFSGHPLRKDFRLTAADGGE